MATRGPRPDPKKAKLEHPTANVIIQFQSPEGETTGGPRSLSIATPPALQGRPSRPHAAAARPGPARRWR